MTLYNYSHFFPFLDFPAGPISFMGPTFSVYYVWGNMFLLYLFTIFIILVFIFFLVLKNMDVYKVGFEPDLFLLIFCFLVMFRMSFRRIEFGELS